MAQGNVIAAKNVNELNFFLVSDICLSKVNTESGEIVIVIYPSFSELINCLCEVEDCFVKHIIQNCQYKR